MTKETLIKFLNNRCTQDELEEVIRWAGEEAFSNKSIGWAQDEWNSVQIKNEVNDDERFSNLFDKIQNKIDIGGIISSNTGHEKKSVALSFTRWVTKAAAILLLPVSVFLFYTLSNKSMKTTYADLTVDSLEIIAPIGSRTVVQLSDGSIVHLNYGSKIKYPQKFNGNTREVTLYGEGYFDVAHNPEKPFIVKTPKLNVKALGTSFNVLAYPDNEIVETTLVGGKIVLEENNRDGKLKTIGSLKPGQHASYNKKTGKILSSIGNIEKYIAWKEGKLIFEDAPIVEVAEKLSRMFNVEIEISEEIKDYNYTVTFVNEPLFQILDLMSIATPIRYKVPPRTKLSDGTFSKQKIIIESRN
jgi:ferric-dicitrate binding protein FerR (iron transport regulator)